MQPNKGNVWITGASSGIGKETAKEFARIGCRVFASARRANLLERLKKELAEDNLDIEIIPCNVASENNVDTAVKKILEFGPLDCLINNAGISSFKPATDNSTNEVKDIVNTNLLGSIFTIRAILPTMIKEKKGTIINIVSVVTQKIFTNSSIYSASKAGLLAYTNVLREEMREHNIKVINVHPGATDTSIWPDKIRENHSQNMLKPEDIARVLVSAYLQHDKIVTEEITIRPIGGDL